MNKTFSLLFYSLRDDSCSGWLRTFVVFLPDPCQCDPGVTVCCAIMLTQMDGWMTDGCEARNEAVTSLPVIFTETLA